MSPTDVAASPIVLGGLIITFLLEPEDSAGSQSLFRVDLARGARMPVPHSHDAFDETVYGLAGRIAFTVDGARTELGPGEVVFIPRGIVHGFEIAGDEDAAMLCALSPGLLGSPYFTELRDVLAAAAGGPPDVGAMMGVMRRHGLTPA